MPIASILANTFQNSSRTGGSLADRATQFFASIQSNFERRNAVRYKTVPAELGHRFEQILLKEPTFCSQCGDLIFGYGQRCEFCKLSSHRKCLDQISCSCNATTNIETSIKKRETCHNLETKTFLTPTYCDHCGTLITGFYEQGLKCCCGLVLHHECGKLVSWPCKKRQVDQPQEQQERPKTNGDRAWGKISINNFDLIGVLGAGSYSKVYLARLKRSQEEFAIKVVKKTNSVVGGDPESIFTEKNVLNLGRQYNFLAMVHCCFQSEHRLYYVMEHVVGRDLLYHIRKDRRFSEARTRFYSAEIALALSFLHKQGVIYRDLKLENVILDKQGHCKLLDFGMSKDLTKTASQKTRTFCGTPSYISPEMIREQDYDYSVDWWSYGVIMYEMLVGKSPFESHNEDDLYKSIVDDELKMPGFLTIEAISILEGLLSKDPNTRLGCQIFGDREKEIFSHKFFTHKWDDILEKRIKPPYIPSLEDLEQMSGDWEMETALSPVVDREIITQSEFVGFSFYSQSFEDVLKDR